MTTDRESLDRLIDLVRREADHFEREIHDAIYTERALRRVEEPRAEAMGVRTLQALVDYVAENRDEIDLHGATIHVAGPDLVFVQGPLNGDRRREVYVQAVLDREGFRFGTWNDLEPTVIGIQTGFVDAGDRADLLKLLGTVTGDEIQTRKDDGITQTVTARSGVQLLERVDVKGALTLAPYRTFAEIEQPESLFILRVRKAHGDKLQAALFEADGGAWRLEAVKRIKAWISKSLIETGSSEIAGVSILA